MGGKEFRFTGASYSADSEGVFRLRRETVFEQISSRGRPYRFRPADTRDGMDPGKREQQDRDRMKRAGKALSHGKSER